jgi:hypothetical protein
MTVFDHIRADITPLLHDLIVQRSGRDLARVSGEHSVCHECVLREYQQPVDGVFDSDSRRVYDRQIQCIRLPA